MKHRVLSRLLRMRVLQEAARASRLYFAPLRADPAYEGGARRSRHRATRILLLLVALTGAGFGAAHLLLPPPFGESIVTGADEWEARRLADGSMVHAGPDSKMNVRYGRGHRRIYLKRGEVLFRVAHDPSRPFDVITGAGEVRAVGTEFIVDYSPPGDARISVTEGAVKVTRSRQRPAAGEEGAGEDGWEPVVLAAGRGAALSGGKIDVAPSGVHWQGDMIQIERATIAEVVAQLSLRGEAKMVVDDPAVASIIIPDLIFSRYEPRRFVAQMASSPNIATYERDGVVHLKSRPGPCASWLICGT